jgi:hypothetical protein
LFDERPDPSASWEVSYYRSLFGVDGVLLVGGGRSTLVTGLIALTLRIPLVAAAMFGGNARAVWELVAKENQADDAVDTAAMGGVWQDTSASRLVQSLSAQRDALMQRRRAEQRQARRESRIMRIGLGVVVALLLVVVAGFAAAWGWVLGAGWSIALLMLLPAVAGAAGALIRTSRDGSGQWARAAVLGGAAGLMTGLLYVASQLIGAPDILQTSQVDSVRRLLFFVLPIGFVAGLTFDAIYAKWQGRDVGQSATLDAMTKAPAEEA